MCQVWLAFVGPPVMHALFDLQTVEQAESACSSNCPFDPVETLHGPVFAGLPVVTNPPAAKSFGDVIAIESQIEKASVMAAPVWSYTWYVKERATPIPCLAICPTGRFTSVIDSGVNRN